VAIKFAGAFDVRRTPEEVYDFLTDPNNVMIELNFDVAKEESNSP
jgi:hypothetical protein